MKAKVFLDTNVLIDFLDNRQGADECENILRLASSNKINLQASTLTMATAAYIVGRNMSLSELYDRFASLRRQMDVVSVSDKAYLKALDARWRDFEDALQHFSAVEADAECIVTRNVKDYTESKIPVMTPEDFLNGNQ